MLWRRITATQAPPAVLLVRVAVGGVFLSEGIQKFLFPGALGVGRFVKIGIPVPQVTAPFVGVVEIAGGLLLVVALLARPRRSASDRRHARGNSGDEDTPLGQK